MGHYAKVKNGIVEEVIRAKWDYIQTLEPEEGVEWVKTSYNTHHGVHYTPNVPYWLPDEKPAIRMNYASVGYTYDSERDAFIPPKPYPSWILDENICDWDSPIPHPDDGGEYDWDEENQKWIPITNDT